MQQTEPSAVASKVSASSPERCSSSEADANVEVEVDSDSDHFSNLDEIQSAAGSDREDWEEAAAAVVPEPPPLPNLDLATGQVTDQNPPYGGLGRIKPLRKDDDPQRAQLSIYCRLHQCTKVAPSVLYVLPWVRYNLGLRYASQGVQHSRTLLSVVDRQNFRSERPWQSLANVLSGLLFVFQQDLDFDPAP